jgi:hypothetical protein
LKRRITIQWRTGILFVTIASLLLVLTALAREGTAHPAQATVRSSPSHATATATGTTSPAGTSMPSPPFNATFYYPWYQTPSVDGAWGHWQDEVTPGYFHHAPSNWNSHYLPDPNPGAFDPNTELYSSADVNTVYWQLSQMKAAHQTVAIASWWGQNDSFGTDQNFRRIVTDYMNRPDNPYPDMRWAVYYEKEGYGDPSVAEIDNDLNYIKTNYASQPGYLWVNGKPVVFVYNSFDGEPGYPDNDVTRWEQARADTGFYVNMKIQPVSEGGVNPSVMDGWHEYGPDSRSGTYGGLYDYISPGFWKEQENSRLARDPPSFTSAVQSMAAANVPWKFTETWNEWIEGTSVEPGTNANWTYDTSATTANPNVATQAGTAFGSTYVNILGGNLPQPSCRIYSSPATGSHQVCGAILAKYQALGGPSGSLGYPTTDETPTPDGIGRFNHFANAGSIYWTPTTGAWSIRGAIRAKWASLGWERSFLGYPVTDETGTPDGIGRFNHFSQSGSIYWTPSTGAWSIHGAVRAKWASLGWERSFLGYPVTDETGTPDGIGRFNHFSSTDNPGNIDGSVYWTPNTGAWSVHGAIRAKWASLGWETSFLGYPLTDETGTPDGVGRFNHFSQSGSIYWTPGTGAWSVHGLIRAKWASLGWERGCLGYPVSDEFGISGGRQSNFQSGVITYSFATGQATSRCG